MVKFDKFVGNFKKIESFVQKESAKILISKNDQIVKMQQDQHHAGLNADSQQMQTGYSKGYTKRRQKKGLQTGFVDLHFTGKYHRELKTVIAKGGIDVKGDVDYEKYLRGNFPNLAGLTQINADKLAELLAEALAPRIDKYLGS